MIDLKTINTVFGEFEERGITKDSVIGAIESAMATAYKKEYGKRGQVVRAKLDMNSGTVSFEQVKTVVDDTMVRFPEPGEEAEVETHDHFHHREEELALGELPRFDSEKHMLLEDAQRMKRDTVLGEEIVFPLEPQDDFGRIAAQTARQVITQKLREAEKVSILSEFGDKKDTIVTGIVQRIERGSIFVDLGRATGVIPYEEQIPGERYRSGERIRAYLNAVDEGFRGIYLRLSRSHPKFLIKLFELEAPELASGTIEIKSIAREAGARTKIAVSSIDPHIDPVGSLVGQRGVRVSTVMSELGGERIDLIEWSDDQKNFIKEALSPATVLDVELDEEEHRAKVTVSEDQQSLAIGRGGQNVRLAARLTGWSIDVNSTAGPEEAGTREEEAPSEESADVITEPQIPDAPETVTEETTQTDEGETVADAEEARDDA